MAKKNTTKKQSLAQPRLLVVLIVGLALIIGGLIGYKMGHRQLQDRGNDIDMWHEMIDGKYKSNWRQGNCQALTINSPQKGQHITSPLQVSVTVDNNKEDCRWSVFEAQAGSADVVNDAGEVIGTTTLTTTEDWTSDEPTHYSGTITFTPDTKSHSYTLVITEENPSGQSGKKVTLPLTY